MTKDINQLSIEIAKATTLEELTKAMPPRLAARFRAWMRSLHPGTRANPSMMNRVRRMMTQKMEELIRSKTLQKNEAMVSAYNNGMVRMDFGSDVSEDVKKAAMAWAKKRGLKAIEASLQKSETSSGYAIFAPNKEITVDEVKCLETKKWTV